VKPTAQLLETCFQIQLEDWLQCMYIDETYNLRSGSRQKIHGFWFYTVNLPIWPSGLSTRAPCAVERDVLRQGFKPQLGRVRPTLPKNYF